jgi:mannose-1-phosphate guanylyltransferase
MPPLPRPDSVAALVIAGGRGTRFWPASRADRPKPLFSIDGKTSLLADTIARTAPLIGRDRIFILVSADQQAIFKGAIEGLVPERNLLVEPDGRGTGVAIAYGGALVARQLGGEAVMAVMPADHFVAPASGFRRTLRDAIGLAASNGAIVVMGVTPSRPESGYGYQKIGPRVGRGFKVERFVEKPAQAVARRMVKSGGYLWNAGIFVMSSSTLGAELEVNAPGLARAMSGFATMSPAALKRSYRRLDYDSFDRLVLEKSSRVLTVRARFRWHDVGS